MIGTVSLIDLLLSAAVSFIALAFLFRPLELVFPAKKQALFRPGWLTDFLFFLGQYLLWSGAVFWLVGFTNKFILQQEWTWLISFRALVAQQPWWLQAIEVVLLSDFCLYWAHRWQHHSPFLWRFHAIHHSAEHMDWLAAHREHPLDTLYTVGVLNLPPLLLGFPLETMAGFIAFRGLWAVYIHSNVKLPLGPLRLLIGAPELHHWHHDRARDAGNYANISPLMDWLFGTYRHPGHEPAAFGISSPMPSGYFQQLWHPFRRKVKSDADLK
jgi:sterol desaturase/sphingolipid hydroxylase (fatty acid hydroxylase superfamily)